MPSRWIRDGALRAFHAEGATGDAAALKLYLALAMGANFKPSPSAAVAGTARLSFCDLETLCEISRRSIARGLRCLETHARIQTHRAGKSHHYVLCDYDETGWAKLPRGHLLAHRRFQAVGIRGTHYLNALKLYLALVTFRANSSAQVLLSYDRMEHYTGVPRPQIRRALDVLMNHEWLSIASHTSESRPNTSVNVYLLRGDFWGRRHANYARATTTSAPPRSV
jgi:hypothetical protein